MISVELVAFPGTNILYGVKHNATASVWEYMANSLHPGVEDLVFPPRPLHPPEDTLVPWNKFIFLYCGNSSASLWLLSSASYVSK